MENLKALVHGHELNDYQRKLAQSEFEAIEKKSLNNVDAHSFLMSKGITRMGETHTAYQIEIWLNEFTEIQITK